MLQERSQESELDKLSAEIHGHLVRLIELLVGSPPQLDCLQYVCDHLLVSDLNDVKFVSGANQLETSMSAYDGEVFVCVYT